VTSAARLNQICAEPHRFLGNIKESEEQKPPGGAVAGGRPAPAEPGLLGWPPGGRGLTAPAVRSHPAAMLPGPGSLRAQLGALALVLVVMGSLGGSRTSPGTCASRRVAAGSSLG